MDEPSLESTLLLAILAVLLEQRADRISNGAQLEKPELLLSRLGLPPPVISAALGKQPDAIKKAIQRSKAKA